MYRVTIRLDTCNNDRAILVSDSFRGADTCCTFGYGLVIDASCIIDCKRDILDTVSVLVMVSGEFGVVRVKR